MTQLVPYDAAEHERFVVGSWMVSYSNSPHVKQLNRDLYYAYQTALIASLLQRSTTVMLEDDGLLLGFACGERVGPEMAALHYVLVKPRDQGMGYARWMIDAVTNQLGFEHAQMVWRVIVTHETKPFDRWLRRMGWRYEPRYLNPKNHSKERS